MFEKVCSPAMCPTLQEPFGHPESSAHWQAHLSKILREKLNGVEFSDMPSVFLYGQSLVMSVYVDDLPLSGVASEHDGFWKTLKQYVNLDPPTEFGRVLGRNHRLVWYGVFGFGKQCVQLYEDLASKPVKASRLHTGTTGLSFRQTTKSEASLRLMQLS